MTVLTLITHMWFTIPSVSPAAWNKLKWNIMNLKYNTPQEGLHEYSIPGSVQLETTHKNVTPSTLWGRRQAKKHRTHRLSLLEASNSVNTMAWQYQRLEFNFQHSHFKSCYYHIQKTKHLPKQQSAVPCYVGKLPTTTASNIKTEIKVCKVIVHLLLLYNFMKYTCSFFVSESFSC